MGIVRLSGIIFILGVLSSGLRISKPEDGAGLQPSSCVCVCFDWELFFPE